MEKLGDDMADPVLNIWYLPFPSAFGEAHAAFFKYDDLVPLQDTGERYEIRRSGYLLAIM